MTPITILGKLEIIGRFHVLDPFEGLGCGTAVFFSVSRDGNLSIELLAKRPNTWIGNLRGP